MNLNMDKRKLAATGLVTAVLVGGSASIAAASDNGSTPATTSSAVGQQEPDGETADGPDGGPGSEQEEQELVFTGSVAAPAETEQADGQGSEGSEDGEQAALQALATLTPQQAEQAALAAVPGSMVETDLDDENGWVVYSVEVNGADGTVTEVVIDAGNGAVLAQQAEDAGDPADEPEGPNDAQD